MLENLVDGRCDQSEHENLEVGRRRRFDKLIKPPKGPNVYCTSPLHTHRKTS